MKLALCMGFIWPVKPCSLSFDSFNEAKMMTASRRVIKFTIGKADLSELESIARSRTEPTITVEAKTWVVALACRKAKELGYPHEVWTTRLLARHAREHGPADGHSCLSGLAQGTVCKILDAQEVKPHKVRYYLERRDP